MVVMEDNRTAQGRKNSPTLYNLGAAEGPRAVARLAGATLAAPRDATAATALREAMQAAREREGDTWALPIDWVAVAAAGRRLDRGEPLRGVVLDLPGEATRAAAVNRFVPGRRVVEAQFLDDTTHLSASVEQLHHADRGRTVARDQRGTLTKPGKKKTECTVIEPDGGHAFKAAVRGSVPTAYRVHFPAKYRRLGAQAGPNLQTELVPVVDSIRAVGVEIDEALEFLPGLTRTAAEVTATARQDAHLLRAAGALWPALLASREAWEQSVAAGATVLLTPAAWPAARKSSTSSRPRSCGLP